MTLGLPICPLASLHKPRHSAWRESKTSHPNKQPKEKYRMRRKQKLVTSILVATGSDMIATVMILGSLAVII